MYFKTKNQCQYIIFSAIKTFIMKDYWSITSVTHTYMHYAELWHSMIYLLYTLDCACVPIDDNFILLITNLATLMAQCKSLLKLSQKYKRSVLSYDNFLFSGLWLIYLFNPAICFLQKSKQYSFSTTARICSLHPN